MKLYRTTRGVLVEEQGRFFPLHVGGWDELIAGGDLQAAARAAIGGRPADEPGSGTVLAPIEGQEVWAAGVTYYRSRDARMEEAKDAGGGGFYDRVYTAERPELFFKATGSRVVGPGGPVRIRSDASWSVPEPEWVVLLGPDGNIMGHTIGNDMSSRDIEGENPLYLPQAKIYTGSCALGPCILLDSAPLAKETGIFLEIERQGETAFSGKTTLAAMKRELRELVAYLFRDNSFPHGVFLMTGTGIVPDATFTLQRGDVVRIRMDGIGTLENPVA
ncbi:MAG: fumarylacetoacetate hydrolase family protein [Bacillota bacterium]|nr:fumarylacetoacetate hydrolase family protein [Pseudacidobacterium ailaaui]MDI3253228.1 fumarylacetoacetate hydrolase family protein [Bacillota bacterium]